MSNIHRLYQHVLARQSLAADAHAIGANAGAELDFTGYSRVMYILNSGVNGAGGTVDTKIQEADSVGGVYADIVGGAFAQVAEANDNAPYILDVPVNPDKPVQKAIGTVAAAACDFGLMALPYGGSSEYIKSQINPVVEV